MFETMLFCINTITCNSKIFTAKMPKDIDWTALAKYETQDMTTGSQELACVAGGCEI